MKREKIYLARKNESGHPIVLEYDLIECQPDGVMVGYGAEREFIPSGVILGDTADEALAALAEQAAKEQFELENRVFVLRQLRKAIVDMRRQLREGGLPS